MKTLFYNATFHTLDDANPVAHSLYTENGIIQNTPSKNDIPTLLNNPNIQKVDLNNQVVLPGFNDAHIHIWKVGDLKTFMADLRGVTSIDLMIQTLLQFSQQNPSLQWILARGFNEALFKEKRMPTKQDLDKAFPHKPVYLIRTCAHIAVVNSKAFEIANITEKTTPPFGGQLLRDQHNKLNGIITETAKGLFTPFLPPYSPHAYAQIIDAASKELLSLGITSATDPAVMPDLLNVYKNLNTQNKLSIRINAIPIGIPDGDAKPLPLPQLYSSPFLNINTIKFFADGGLSGQTAALYKPYKNNPHNYGVLRLNYNQFYPIALHARQQGWKIATHAIGDKAIHETLRVYNDIQTSAKTHAINRIEHLGIPTQQALQQIHNLHIAVVTQPIFIKELGQNFIDSLPNHYLDICYPFKAMFDANINVAFSTDAPVVKSINPFHGIQTAIDRKTLTNQTLNPHQSVNLLTALKAYTIGSAIAQQEHLLKGSLTKNKFADFIVINQDIFKPNTLIHTTQVLQTFIAAKKVYQHLA